MRDRIEEFKGIVDVEQFRGGQSNPTYKIVSADRSYVLRRKPSGDLVKSAHAIDREATVMKALRDTEFPVPNIYGACDDSSIIGTPFFVMEFVPGRIFRSAAFEEVAEYQRPTYFEAMCRTIAQLHMTPYSEIGLSNFGPAGNYFERQFCRWSKQYAQDVIVAGRDSNMDRLLEWLPSHIPSYDEERSIIHGDFRCDNLIFHPNEPRVIAVLDWELSTLGSPLADFAYNAMMYRLPPHILSGLAGLSLSSFNLPSEEQYCRWYCGHTGRKEIKGYDYYIAFSLFKVAAIFHGIKARLARGTAASLQASECVRVLPELSSLAWNQANRVTQMP